MERPSKCPFIDRSVFDVRSLRAVDCDTDHYLVVKKLRERLTLSKHITHIFHMKWFSLKKLNEVGCKEQYYVKIRIGSQL
jgi:hypothetical protein